MTASEETSRHQAPVALVTGGNRGIGLGCKTTMVFNDVRVTIPTAGILIAPAVNLYEPYTPFYQPSSNQALSGKMGTAFIVDSV